MEGKNVRLEFDVQQKDKYGRLLAYVYAGDTFVNAELVKQGYAQITTYPPNVKYVNHFKKLEKEAREQGRGLWASAKPVIPGIKKETCYTASIKSKVFHSSGCPHVKKIIESNKVIFSTREEAVKSGRRPCKKCKP